MLYIFLLKQNIKIININLFILNLSGFLRVVETDVQEIIQALQCLNRINNKSDIMKISDFFLVN